MAGEREKPKDTVLKLRKVEVLQGQGKSVQEAVRQIGATVQTYYRWRKENGGMNRDQLKRLRVSAPLGLPSLTPRALATAKASLVWR